LIIIIQIYKLANSLLPREEFNNKNTNKMRKFTFILILLMINNLFCQKVNREKETKETLDWINSKITEFQYEDSDGDLKQLCVLINVEKIDSEYYLVGTREQKTSQPWAFKFNFKIPISKINNISFEEKHYNYWLIIKMKNNEKAIINFTEEDPVKENIAEIEIMLNKNIDKEDLKPRLLKAFNHILQLYGNIKTEKF